MQRKSEYSSDVEDGAPVRVAWTITGRMNLGRYLDFVVERANWLGLDGWVAANDDASVSLAVAGPEALVGGARNGVHAGAARCADRRGAAGGRAD